MGKLICASLTRTMRRKCRGPALCLGWGHAYHRGTPATFSANAVLSRAPHPPSPKVDGKHGLQNRFTLAAVECAI